MAKKSKANRRKGTSRSKQQAKGKTNFADILIRLIDAMYDLAQTGNLIGLILFGIICWVFYVTYKLPTDALQGFLGGIGEFIVSESFYLIPLLSVLTISVITNYIQAKVYRQHIQDLTDHRKVLIHGLERGELKKLSIHHTSGFDIKNGSVGENSGE